MPVIISSDISQAMQAAVTGDLDARTGSDVVDLLDQTHPDPLELDVSAVGHLSADGLHRFALAIRRARRHGRPVAVRGARPCVALLLAAVGVATQSAEETPEAAQVAA